LDKRHTKHDYDLIYRYLPKHVLTELYYYASNPDGDREEALKDIEKHCGARVRNLIATMR
tara:strand:- start:374 stop:553 length:180 start_codon:yes stop_codon:yes gene_type:complete